MRLRESAEGTQAGSKRGEPTVADSCFSAAQDKTTVLAQ
jgi:hypothetical protein